MSDPTGDWISSVSWRATLLGSGIRLGRGERCIGQWLFPQPQHDGSNTVVLDTWVQGAGVIAILAAGILLVRSGSDQRPPYFSTNEHTALSLRASHLGFFMLAIVIGLGLGHELWKINDTLERIGAQET